MVENERWRKREKWWENEGKGEMEEEEGKPRAQKRGSLRADSFSEKNPPAVLR